MLQDGWHLVCGIHAKKDGVPCRRAYQTKEHTNRSTFASPIGAKKAKDISPHDLKVKIIHGNQLPIRFGQAAGTDDDL
jgi:hypothetical protein